MPTIIAFTIDDLDAQIKAVKPEWNNRSDYATLRNLAYRRTLAEYEDGLRSSDDLFIRLDTSDSPITTGTEKVNTTTGDIFKIALPTGATRVAGDAILVEKGTTSTFINVPRMSWQDIIAAGTGQTTEAFWENNGKIMLYCKQGEFDNTAAVVFDYYRELDSTQTTGTALDIKAKDFEQVVKDTISFLEDYI